VPVAAYLVQFAPELLLLLAALLVDVLLLRPQSLHVVFVALKLVCAFGFDLLGAAQGLGSLPLLGVVQLTEVFQVADDDC